jgi:AGZA family xanthine/uracil permease-like MFS transporter
MSIVATSDALERSKAKWFVAGDLDGYFALFFSGFPDLLLIVGLGPLCGFTSDFVTQRILPAVALSILAGNLFYAWQARQLAKRTGRSDVTAIPFGVNTPTIFAYIFLIMVPVFNRTKDPELTWQVGMLCCFLSGIVQTVGSFCTDWLRRTTPRAALLCPIAGIALAFLCLGFVFQIFQNPALALLPAVIILTFYSSHLRLPGRLPAALLCIVVGIFAALILQALNLYQLPDTQAITSPGFCLPKPVNVWDFLRRTEGWKYLPIILSMSLLDTIVSLQVLESVKVAGDDYPTRPSLLVNGVATLGAAVFGSAFPTTLYFGHMAHKSFGARAGYSVLNGVTTMLICLTGVVPLVLHFVPLAVVAIIVIWFGLAMVGQAFTEVPKNHAIAVCFGLIPMLASWALELLDLGVRKGGSSLFAVADSFGEELPIYGLIAISQGAVLTSMLWAATLAFTTDRRFFRAALWIFAGAILSFFGLIHAFQLTPQGIDTKIGWCAAPEFAISYALAAIFLVVCHFLTRRPKSIALVEMPQEVLQ